MEQESIPPGGSSPSVRSRPGATFGRYRLLEKLGEGGMAAVYRAEVKGKGGFKKLVALKLVHPHLALQSAFTEGFISEALLGGYLAHPHIVQTLDFGEHEGCLFIAMEYVHGRTLAQILNFHRERGELLPPDVAMQIAVLVFRGLDYAHQARDHEGRPLRMVHRDLKPSNILIGGHGEVKIADFGVARAESNLSHTGYSGALKGTLGYMSPEQAWGMLNLDHRSDLFCAGILLFEMLTLLPLYEGRSEPVLIRRAQDAEIAPRLELLPDMPERGPLLRFLARALAREPAERFATAGEMAEALEQILERVPRRQTLIGWLAGLDRRMSAKESPASGSVIDLGEFLVEGADAGGAGREGQAGEEGQTGEEGQASGGEELSLARGGEGGPALAVPLSPQWPEGLDARDIPVTLESAVPGGGGGRVEPAEPLESVVSGAEDGQTEPPPQAGEIGSEETTAREVQCVAGEKAGEEEKLEHSESVSGEDPGELELRLVASRSEGLEQNELEQDEAEEDEACETVRVEVDEIFEEGTRYDLVAGGWAAEAAEADGTFEEGERGADDPPAVPSPGPSVEPDVMPPEETGAATSPRARLSFGPFALGGLVVFSGLAVLVGGLLMTGGEAPLELRAEKTAGTVGAGTAQLESGPGTGREALESPGPVRPAETSAQEERAGEIEVPAPRAAPGGAATGGAVAETRVARGTGVASGAGTGAARPTRRRASVPRTAAQRVELKIEPPAQISVRGPDGRELSGLPQETASSVTLRLVPGEYEVILDPGFGKSFFRFPLEVEARPQRCRARVEQKQVQCH